MIKEKWLSGVADRVRQARRSHGFHTGLGTFYRSKGIKATALKFQHIKAHIYMKLNVFTFTLYLSIRISSSMHLVIFVAPTFHFIKTLKGYFFFMITLRWTGPNNGNRTLAPNTSKMVNKNTNLDKLPFFLTCNC